MVEQLPVKRQLPGVIQVATRGEFGETPTEGNPEPSSGNREGVETIPLVSFLALATKEREYSKRFGGSASHPTAQAGMMI